MLKFEMRTSPRLVLQVGIIERFSGMWERLSQSDVMASESAHEIALQRGAEACLRLDSTSPAGLSMFIEVQSSHAPQLSDSLDTSNTTSNPITSMLEAHTHPAGFDLVSICDLWSLIVRGRLTSENETLSSLMRHTGIYFTAPEMGPRGDERVFPAVSPFLVEQRLSELLEWTEHELEEGVFHPLFIIGTFHLLFLQIQPFPSANHRLSLVLLWRLLDMHGYGFVRYSHFAPEIEQRSKQYFASLRQAEKTAYNNWSTLNNWLEFFLDVLVLASQNLLEKTQRDENTARLTQVQRKIIDVIKSSGSATREKIVTETGINLSTVKYNLSILANKGHLKRDGGGRSTSYRLL